MDLLIIFWGIPWATRTYYKMPSAISISTASSCPASAHSAIRSGSTHRRHAPMARLAHSEATKRRTMERATTLRIILWSLRLVLLPFLLFWMAIAGQIASNYWRGGIQAIAAWFYWHVVMMGVPLEQHAPDNVFRKTNQYYLGYILLLTVTEALVLAQWSLSKKLKAIRAKSALH